MKMKLLAFLIIVSMLIVSCQNDADDPTPTPQTAESTEAPAPTEAPTEEPVPTEAPVVDPTEEVAEPSEVEVEADMANLTALVGQPWQWVSFTNPAESFDVDIPNNYVATFNADGSVTFIADCNNAAGDYTADGSSLTITVGPSTLALCPGESRSEQFLSLLGGAAIFFFEDGNLFIDLMADGGTMEFSPAPIAEQVPGGVEGTLGGQLPEELVAQLDAFLQSQVYSEGGNPQLAAPGLVLYVETPDGVYLNAAGVANLDDSTLVEPDDLLEIGSNTKSMTIVLLMQLVEQGLISLDDHLADYLPEQAALFEHGDEITIRQLAQHTAGLFDYADIIIASGLGSEEAMEAGFTPEELVQVGADNPAYFAPGEEGQWHYSNTGYVLLGMIIESLTGNDLGTLYLDQIFKPLGMDSAFLLEGVPQSGDLDTHGYWFQPDGTSLDTTNWNASQAWAAGGVVMTAADLATYGKGLAAGELFQNPETLQEMLTWNEAAELSVGFPYGLGLGDFAGDGSAWGHAGQTLGFQSLWYIDPENDIVVVGLTNSASYKADSFVNVLNILKENGALPFTPFTLLPVGPLYPSQWRWIQFTNPSEASVIDPAEVLVLIMAKDQTVTVGSDACGTATGSFTVDGTGQISFSELDRSGFTCEADSLAGQLVQHVQDATRWYFDNGNLVIELPADGGTLIFEAYTPSE